MNKYAKFAALITIVVGTVVWLGFRRGMRNARPIIRPSRKSARWATRYTRNTCVWAATWKTVPSSASGTVTQLFMVQDKERMTVIYTGTDPLPDTFKDGAQALADGKLDRDGVFRAARIQAKCASKYEAKPGSLAPGAAPNINTGKGTI